MKNMSILDLNDQLLNEIERSWPMLDDTQKLELASWAFGYDNIVRRIVLSKIKECDVEFYNKYRLLFAFKNDR